MPQKTYHFATPPAMARPLTLPAGVTVRAVLDRVLRLVDVGSKRFLTNKVRAALPAVCRWNRFRCHDVQPLRR